jgi:hypothetical protein
MAKGSLVADNVLPDMKEIDKIDPAIYNDIARCAELLSVQLIESSFTISPSFFDAEDGKHGVDFSHVHASFDTKSRITTCIFQFENYKKKDRRKVFSLKDKFAVFYRVPIECDEAHAVAFATKTGVMACYPYFRAHASNIASLANAEMPILPTIASMPMKKGAKNE